MEAVRVTDPGTSPWSFDWLRREVAEPPAYATRAATWLFGAKHGVPVVVRPVSLPDDQPAVAVVAEIDPPLFAGLWMIARSLLDPFRFAGAYTTIGDSAIDRSFVTRVHDRERAQRLFSRSRASDELAWAIGEAGQRDALVIDDRTVASYLAGAAPEESRIADAVELVTTLARRFAERAPTLPERPDEANARESWARAVAGSALVFDRARWKISGDHDGRRVEVHLDGIPPAVSTSVRVSFRFPLGAGLFLRSGFREKRKVSASGHRELDRSLLFDARDREKALAAVADPQVRAAIAAESRTSNFTMTDRAITCARGGFMRGREVSVRIQALAGIVDRITPMLRNAGPFR